MKNKNQTMILSALVAGLAVCGASARPEPRPPLDCGAILTSNTTLQNDLDCSGPGAALVIGADNITVNLNGHTLTGNGSGVGIDNSGGFAHGTIKNGTITGFSEGIRAVGANGLRINGIQVIGANGHRTVTGAIHIRDSEDVEIKNSAVTVTPTGEGPHGIRLDKVKNVAVQNVRIDGGFSGVSFFGIAGEGATTGRIQDCTIRNGWNSGVLLARTDDARVKNNEMSGCYLGMQIGTGFFVSNIQVSGNNIHNNELGGIYALAMVDSRISDNALTDNADYGINLDEACTNNVVSGNLVANNGRRGIFLTSYDDPLYRVNNNRISGNAVLNNGLEGISLFLGINTGNQITDNTSLGNGVWDLFHNEESTPNVWKDNTYNTKSGADIP
jgi:parallel beta-helix repeat protein